MLTGKNDVSMQPAEEKQPVEEENAPTPHKVLPSIALAKGKVCDSRWPEGVVDKGFFAKSQNERDGSERNMASNKRSFAGPYQDCSDACKNR